MSAPCPQPIITIKNPLEAKMSECPRCCSRNKLDDNVRKVIFDPKFCDVVFLVGDSRKEFPVIRGYFAPHSTYFADLLFNQESIKSKQIIEKDVTVTAFEFIHKYCYRLYPDITVDNVVEVLFAAQKYELTLLITDCTAYIDSKISNNNINEILFIQQKAIHFSVNIVIEQFNQWLSVENSKRILESEGFISLSKEVVMYLIQHNSFSVNESDIWTACKNWCEFQAKTGEQNNWTVLMNDFTPHIRFTLMKQEFFAQNVYPTNVLTSQQFAQISLYFMNPTVAKINFITSTTQRINVYYAAQNDLYRTAQCLQYTLNISNAYECKDMDGSGLLNNYQRITNNDVNDFIATATTNNNVCDESMNNDTNNEFVEAQFAGKVRIVRMDIGGPALRPEISRMQWNVQHINGRKVEYKGDDGKWIDWKSFDDLKQNEIRTVDVDIQTTAMRILDTTKGHIAVGCWRFYGHNMFEENDVAEEKTNNEMMICSPELVKPPELPQEPAKNARAYFSDQLIAPKYAIPYDTTGKWSSYSDYVGQGSYPRNREAFPNASRGTFDAIAIDANTRVILYEKENFQGKVLLDATGPMLINNVIHANSALMTDTFQDSEIERNYPPSTRCWSETNMQSWTTGSVKIVAANSNLS